MAAAASCNSVTFEVSFRGEPLLGFFNLKFDTSKQDISVAVDHKFQGMRDQLLAIRLRTGEGDVLQDLVNEMDPERAVWGIAVPVRMASSLSIDARVFTSYQTQENQTSTRAENLTIPITEKETMAAGENYRIQLINEQTKLIAKIVKKANIASEAANQSANAAADNDLDKLLQEFKDAKSASTDHMLASTGIARANQETHPDVAGPPAKSSKNPADLDKWSTVQLQKRFDEAYTDDKWFENERLQAASRGDMARFNQLMDAEMENSQLIINLSEALERRGVKAQIPQSEEFQAAAQQSQDAHQGAIQNLVNQCNQQ